MTRVSGKTHLTAASSEASAKARSRSANARLRAQRNRNDWQGPVSNLWSVTRHDRFGTLAPMVTSKRTTTRKPKQRCWWCGDDPQMVKYHDEEWGVPVHDDRVLFEFLTLEGAQAGLSWNTILRKREAYRTAFASFDVQRVARFTPLKLEGLMLDPGIVRNRLKLESTVKNARAFLRIQEEFGTFSAYQWRFVEGAPIQNGVRARADIPARTVISDALSKDLKKRGFSFVGSTIMYAHMQAVGMVNDHWVECFRFAKLAAKIAKASN